MQLCKRCREWTYMYIYTYMHVFCVCVCMLLKLGWVITRSLHMPPSITCSWLCRAACDATCPAGFSMLAEPVRRMARLGFAAGVEGDGRRVRVGIWALTPPNKLCWLPVAACKTASGEASHHSIGSARKKRIPPSTSCPCPCPAPNLWIVMDRWWWPPFQTYTWRCTTTGAGPTRVVFLFTVRIAFGVFQSYMYTTSSIA
jgi:hypothetical protein